MIVLCGKPGEGLHRFRVAGVAIVDVIITVVAAAAVALVFKKNFLVSLGALFLIGIGVHALLGIDTAVNRRLKCLVSRASK
jgi:uncharacterized membrane protein